MEGKIGGTVRQIEAGDELSGSIINPHPLLFNILKTHTHRDTHTRRVEQQLPEMLSAKRSGSKDPPNVKDICRIPKVSDRVPSLRHLLDSCVLHLFCGKPPKNEWRTKKKKIKDF